MMAFACIPLRSVIVQPEIGLFPFLSTPSDDLALKPAVSTGCMGDFSEMINFAAD
jgi:hypothetical protein